MGNNKGITLITLIISVILILVITSITVITGLDSYNYMKFEGQKAEIEEMEKKVDEIASDYQTYLTEVNGNKSYTEYFNSRYNSSDFDTKLLSNYQVKTKKLIEAKTELSSSSNTKFYFSEDDLIKYFDLKGIDPVVVDFSTRKVYSVKGIKDPDDKKKIYYTSSDWGGDTKVDHIDTPVDNEKFKVKKLNSINSYFDIELEISKKLDNISKIYAFCSTTDPITIKKIENFHIVKCDDSGTRIQFNINGKGIYVFKVVNDVNEGYESESLNLIDEFYFEVQHASDTVVFPRTSDAKDYDNILTTESNDIKLTVKNNNGTNFNTFKTDYEISIVDDISKFSLKDGDKITKTIEGNSKIDDEISFKLKINDIKNPEKKVKLKVITTAPYELISYIDLKIDQQGCIQTIEDLVDLSKKLKTSNSSDRFKMTRDLDFNDKSSYENSERTDYNDVNNDGVNGGTLYKEMTENAGFFPIGSETHKFSGVFNGGGYKISNLRIKNDNGTNVGLFGFITTNSDIKNFTISNAYVDSNNQTAGVVVGKATGGTISKVTVDENSSVTATGKYATGVDTYTGGIAGFVEFSAKILNCTNKGSVTTQFTGDVGKHSGPAGGITGWMGCSSIENCSNYGLIKGQKYVGGISGFAGMQNSGSTTGSGNIKSCHNYGNITIISLAKTDYDGPGCYIGGICGYNKNRWNSR